jgi:hypothetical protein
MSDFLVAYFYTQMEAASSVERLLSCGVQSNQVTLHVMDRPEAGNDGTSDMIMVPDGTAAHAFLEEGITLNVTLKDSVMINDVCTVLKDTGAYLIDVTEHNVTQEYPDM